MLKFNINAEGHGRSTPNSRQNTVTHATTVVRCWQVAWCVRIPCRVSVYFKVHNRLN